MKPFIIVANWKSHKDTNQTKVWFTTFAREARQHVLPSELTIVLSIPFTDLYPAKEMITEHTLPILLGAQDISPYSGGAYTGEESAQMIHELASWVLIGHSERRMFMGEADEELAKEVVQAKRAALRVVYCVSSLSQPVPSGIDVVAYEPPEAIGSGNPKDPTDASTTIGRLKKQWHVPLGLYGGSVTPENVGAYCRMRDIDGVLVGGASLDPHLFLALIDAVRAHR